MDEWLERGSAHLKGPGLASWSRAFTSIAGWIPDLAGACAGGNQSADVSLLTASFLSPSLPLLLYSLSTPWKKYPDNLRGKEVSAPEDLKKKKRLYLT